MDGDRLKMDKNKAWATTIVAPKSVGSSTTRQWPEVYDSCHSFLHVARVRKHTDMRELQLVMIAREKRAIFACPCVTRAILACPCFFLLAQRAKTCDKI